MEIFSIVTTVKKGADTALEALLKGIDPQKLFGRIKTVHFASFIVFPAKRFGHDQSSLVFEINVDDGSSEAFVSTISGDETIRLIYDHCDDCGSGTYLEDHIRWPELFHVGTPYRSAASIRHDQVLREKLDVLLFTRDGLADLLDRPTGGMLQYWNWELFQPWIAWVIGLFVTATAPFLFMWLWRTQYPILARAIPHVWRDWSDNGVLGVYRQLRFASRAQWSQVISAATFWALGVGYVPEGLRLAVQLWFTALPPLRARVKAWVPWLVGCAAVILMVSLRRRPWSIALAVSFTALLAFNVYKAVTRRQNERLAEIRPENDTRSIVSAWNELLGVDLAGERRPAWWRRLWNFRWWAVSCATVWVALMALSYGGRRAIVGAVAVLYLSKALWLSMLVGWPENGSWVGFSRAIVWFVVWVTGAATVGAIALTGLNVSPSFLAFAALLVIGTIFALWGIPLPSPATRPRPLARSDAERLDAEEDRDVQNHMAAVVVLKDNGCWILSRVRVGVLKILLGILNAIFFRAWLPDVCKGKLFKLPTVHACQWLVLDNRNYLFLSNYDNSWTTYLDDFGIELGVGIQKIWGQGEGNPGTGNVVKFKEFARSTMVPYALWYQAYPGLTVRQIWNNEIIRHELVRGAGEEAMVRALRRFGAAPEIPADLVAHARVN
jgi:hypothetical protein